MDDRQRQFAQFATAINQYASSNSANGDRGPPGRTSADGRSSTGSTSSGSSSSGGSAPGAGSGGGGGGGSSGSNAAAALWGDLSRAFPFNYSGISSGSAWPPSTHQGGSDYHRYGAYGSFNDGPPDNRASSEVRRVPSKGETKATPPLPAGLSPNVGSTFASLQQLVGIPILAQQYAAAAAFSALPPSTRAPLSPIPPIPPGRSSLSPTGAPPSQIHGSSPPLLTGRHYSSRQRQHPPPPMLSQQKASSPPVSLLSPVGLHPQTSPPEGGSNLNGEYLDHSNRAEPPHGSPSMRKERLIDHAAHTNPDPLSPLGRLTPPHGGEHERNDQAAHHHPYSGGSGGSFYGSDKQTHMGGHPGSEASSRGHDTGGRSGSESEGDHRVRHRRKQDQPRRQTVIYSNPGPGGYSAPPPGPPPPGGHPGDHCHAPSAEESSSDDSQGYEAPLSRHRNGAEGPQSTSSGPPPAVSTAGPTQLPISQAMSHALSHPFLAAHLNTSGHGPFLKGESQYSSRGEYNSNSPSTDAVKDHCYKEMDPGPLQKSHNNIHLYSHYIGSTYPSKGTSKDPGPYYQMEREQLQGPPVGSTKEEYSPVVGPPQRVAKENQRGASHYKEEAPVLSKGVSLHPHSYVGGEGRTTPQADGDINRPASTTAQSHLSAPETCETAAAPPALSFNDQVGDTVPKGSDPTPFRYEDAMREKESGHIPDSQHKGANPPASVDGEASTVERRIEDVSPTSLPSTQTSSGTVIPNSNGTNFPTSETATKGSNHSTSSNAHMPSAQPSETCCYDGKRGASPSPTPGVSPHWKGVHSPSKSPTKMGVSQGVLSSAPSKSQPDGQMPPLHPSSSQRGNESLVPEATDAILRDSKVEIDALPSATSVKESHEEALMNGTSSPSPRSEALDQELTPKHLSEGGLKVPERGLEPMNGDLEHLLSPGKHKKRRRTEEEEEIGETKRRTRQKRPVSYVEDETDPVLETSEDSFPVASPVKKRGRKGRDKAELADPPTFLVSQEATPSKELGLSVYDGSTNCLNEDPHQRLGPSSSPENGEEALSHGSDRLLQLSGKVPPNFAEPLHIDTSGAFKGPFRVHGGHNPPTPTLHSPDIYDFHDADGDSACHGNRGKRGRKRGSPKKQTGQATPEYLRSNLSPRAREGSCSRSPRSPKFFSSSRNTPDRMASINERPRLASRCPEDDSSNPRISNGTILPLPLPHQDSTFCRYPPSTRPSQSPSLDIPVKPIDMGPPAPLRGGSPSVLAASSSGRIVDEVEKQLAALHKEHLPDTPTPSPREAQDPTIGVPVGPVLASDLKKTTPVEGDRKPVHKPMLSVVPLEQLTYEGLRNKTASMRSPLPIIETSLNTKSPSSLFSVEPPPFGLLPDAAPHPLGLEPPPPPTDPLALPSPPNREKLSESLVNPDARLQSLGSTMGIRLNPSELGKEPMPPLGRNELCKGVPSMGFHGLVDSHLMDRVASSIPVTEQSVHMVSVAEASPPVAPGTRKRGGGSRGRTAGLPPIAPGVPPYSNGNSIAASVTSTMVNISTPATSESPLIPRVSLPEPLGMVNHAIPGCASSPSSNTKSDTQDTQPQLRRRSRRGTNTRGGSPSSPPQLNAIPRPPSRSDDPAVLPSAFNNRVPPTHKEALDSTSTLQRDPTNPPTIHPVATVDLEPGEGETLEDIAKFLEATAPSTGGALSPGIPPDASRRFSRPLATPASSSSEEVVSSSASSSANTSLVSPPGGDATPGGSSYREGRPKRVSRPPPQMNDGEMNDLLLLLNMEDEESEDEDYIPLEEDEDEEAESDGRDTADDETPGEVQAEAVARVGAGQDGKKRSRPPVDSNFNARSPPLRKKAAATPSKKGCSAKKARVGPPQLQSPAPTTRRRTLEDGGERKKDDRRGPLIRLAPAMSDPEVILNAPDRDDDEPDRARKGAASFSLDSSSGTDGGGSSRGTTKVGFNSTLHNNYDAFNKDLHWFCAFCKNYSHFWGLGDLFGPFYIKGVSIRKKSFPDVIDGQVACSNGLVGSPIPQGVAAPVTDSHGIVVTPTKQKNKRVSVRGDSSSVDSHGPDVKRLEMGGSSPPSRFVPAATPARMLGRCASTSNGGRLPVQSPRRSPQPAPPVEYSIGVTGEGAISPPGTECWLHEGCVLWASGVSAVNSKLYGLDDALIAAQDSLCIHCDETGATVSCLKRGCHDIVHVPCATRLQWTLDDQTFQSFCPKHTRVADKAFIGGGSGGSRKANTSSQHLKKL